MRRLIQYTFITLLTLGSYSCSQEREYTIAFQEGLYRYEEDPVLFYKEVSKKENIEIYLEEVQLELKEISEEEFNSTSINVIKNRYDNKTYEGIFMMKFSITELIKFDFEYSFNNIIPDDYYLKIETKDQNDKSVQLEFRLEPSGVSLNEKIAKYFLFSMPSFKINNEYKKNDFTNWRTKLNLNYQNIGGMDYCL